MNIQKSMLKVNYQKIGIKEKVQFIITSERIKYPEINLPKKAKPPSEN